MVKHGLVLDKRKLSTFLLGSELASREDRKKNQGRLLLGFL